MFWLLLTLQMLAGFVAGESAIRKYPEGNVALETLSKSGLFFLKWRAYASYKQDLTHLRNIFGICLLIFGAMLLMFGPSKEPSLLDAIPGIFLILWLTMQFGTNFKKSVSEQFSMVGILVIGPWLILGLDYLTEFQFNQLRLMASPLEILGFLELSNYELAIALSVLLGACGLFMAIFSILVFSIVPLFFLFVISTMSLISRRALEVKPKTAYNFAISYCFVIGPILIGLESKGVI